MSLRIAFMGTPEFSATVLQALIDSDHQIVGVYSQPPRPAGRRGLELVKSPVQLLAENHGLEVLTPISLKDSADQQDFAALNVDVAVVVAYGLILPKPVLSAPRFGCLNIHASLLPRWRGAAPLQRAIMAGDAETGVMIMKMDEGLDTGPVALTSKVTIEENLFCGQLHDILANRSGPLLIEALGKLENSELVFTPQSKVGANYAHKISKSETRIDWSNSARDVHNHIRGLAPTPAAWCEMVLGGNPVRVKILESRLSSGTGNSGTVLNTPLEIACGEGSIKIIRLQKAGAKPMDAETFCSGNPIQPGTIIQ